jgi:tetratricopeptide (TPR) repeat protein
MEIFVHGGSAFGWARGGRRSGTTVISSPVRPMTRYISMSHAILLFLVFSLPLMRVGWDQWAQTIVHLVWAFLLVLGAVLLLMGRSGDFSLFQFVFNRWGPPFTVFLGTSLLSALNSSFSRSAFPAFLNDIPLVAFFFLGAVASVGRRFHYSQVLAGTGVVAVLAAFVGSGGASSWTGPLLNPNILVALLILTGPLTIHFFTKSDSPPLVRGFWGVAAFIVCAGVLLSHSMAGYAVAAVQGVVAVMLSLRRRENMGKRSWILLVAILLLVGAGFYLVRGEWPKLLHGDSDRWTWWATALRAFSSHPFLGVGPGAFGEAYPAFRASPWGLNSLYAHNFGSELLAERGLAGAGVLFLLIGTILYQAWRGVVRGTSPALFLGLAGFCLYNLFHIGFSFPGLFWLFFLASGLAIPLEDVPPIEWSRGRWIKLSFFFLGGGLLLGAASYALFRGDQAMARARYFISTDQWDRVSTQVEQGLRWNPRNPALYEIRAAVRVRSQDWEGASSDISRAIRLAPAVAGFRVGAAQLALEKGDAEQAIRHYERVNQLMPLQAAPWESRADLLVNAQRIEEADQAYQGALRALSDPRVLGGDQDRRAAWTQRIENKVKALRNDRKN